jgi:uncharacterized protein YcgI (DUF1989 family)
VAERVLREVVVLAAHGGAIEVRAGESLSIIDLEGAQVADLVALQRDDPRRFLSPHQTRSTLRRWTLRVGDRLVLRAFTDVVAAVSSCPMDLSPVNAGRITPLKLAVGAAPDPE